MNLKETAKRLNIYIRERADWEGVGYFLDGEFFIPYLAVGIRQFFGVIVSDTGELVADEKFPEFFDRRRQ